MRPCMLLPRYAPSMNAKTAKKFDKRTGLGAGASPPADSSKDCVIAQREWRNEMHGAIGLKAQHSVSPGGRPGYRQSFAMQG